MSHKHAYVLGIACSLCLLLSLLGICLYGLPTSEPVMLGIMRRDAPERDTHLPEAYYPDVVRMITRYLQGKETSFQYTLNGKDGIVYPLFQAHEQAHMQDCQSLFTLLRNVLFVLIPLTVLLGALCFLRRHERRMLKGLCMGCLILFAGLLLLSLWGVINFSGLFITFHRLAFRNQLWLLNPQTDLLIRLMPTDFFIHYVILILLCFCLGAIAYTVCLMLALRRQNQQGVQRHDARSVDAGEDPCHPSKRKGPHSRP